HESILAAGRSAGQCPKALVTHSVNAHRIRRGFRECGATPVLHRALWSSCRVLLDVDKDAKSAKDAKTASPSRLAVLAKNLKALKNINPSRLRPLSGLPL